MSPSSLLVRLSSRSLCLLDFHVLALGNELLGEVVSHAVFPVDEGAVKMLADTFQRKMRMKGRFILLPVSLRTCQQSSDMSLAGIEQL